jgi:hypothetical protein
LESWFVLAGTPFDAPLNFSLIITEPYMAKGTDSKVQKLDDSDRKLEYPRLFALSKMLATLASVWPEKVDL